MRQLRSRDGTTIAYDRLGPGGGPPVILVDGAFCSRSFGPMPKLAPFLARDFTVFMYDRRGRGASGDTAPYAVEREIDDLDALIREAGGSAFVYTDQAGRLAAFAHAGDQRRQEHAGAARRRSGSRKSSPGRDCARFRAKPTTWRRRRSPPC